MARFHAVLLIWLLLTTLINGFGKQLPLRRVGSGPAEFVLEPKAHVASGHKRFPWSSAALKEASLSSASSTQSKVIDWSALCKYVIAIGTQMSIVSALLAGLDVLVKRFQVHVPIGFNFFMFYILALKSRVFNPLSNQRPQATTLETGEVVADKRKMPSWTPPGVVFPIMWLLIIAPIRSITSCMVYNSVGRKYLSLPILSLMLHLSIGDVWNTINNVERRYGASVTGVAAVWLSKAHAAYQYSLVNTTAGKLLALPLIWLSVASALIAHTWRLNPDPISNKCDSLIPKKTKGEASRTKFAWFAASK